LHVSNYQRCDDLRLLIGPAALELDLPDSAATQHLPIHKIKANQIQNAFTKRKEKEKKNEIIDYVYDAVVIISKVKNNNSLLSIPTFANIKSALPVVCFYLDCLKRQQHNLQA
jgi:hypothetical protein